MFINFTIDEKVKLLKKTNLDAQSWLLLQTRRVDKEATMNMDGYQLNDWLDSQKRMLKSKELSKIIKSDVKRTVEEAGLTVDELKQRIVLEAREAEDLKVKQEEEAAREAAEKKKQEEEKEKAKRVFMSEHNLTERDLQLFDKYFYPMEIELHKKLHGGVEILKRIARRTEKKRLLEQSYRDIVPEKFANYTFENFKVRTPEQKDVFDKVTKFKKSGKQFLVLYGNYGAGKTHLAFALARSVMFENARYAFIVDNDFPGGTDLINPDTWTEYRMSNLAYFTGDELAGKKRHLDIGFAKDDDGEIFDYLKFVKDNVSKNSIIIIDEVGQGCEKDFQQQAIFNFVDQCQKKNRLLILISNLDRNTLLDFLTQRTVDRISASCEFVEFKGKSYRREIGKSVKFNIKEATKPGEFRVTNYRFSERSHYLDDPFEV